MTQDDKEIKLRKSQGYDDVTIEKECEYTSDFLKAVDSFVDRMSAKISKDNETRKSIIVLAVEEHDEDDASSVIHVAGDELNLIYSLTEFATKKGTSSLLKKALGFLIMGTERNNKSDKYAN